MYVMKIKLTAATIRILLLVVDREISLIEITKTLRLSQKTVSQELMQLEDSGFIIKKRSRQGITISLSDKDYALKFKDLAARYHYLKYQEILPGKNLDFLLLFAFSGKTTNEIGKILDVQARTVRERMLAFLDFGLIYREKRRYYLSDSIKELKIFLKSIRTYYTGAGRLLWGLFDEQLIQVNKPEQIKGYSTGFNEYEKFGVLIYTIKGTCYVGKTKPVIEEIFIHSLFEIEDSRTLGLAITFFVKNNLKKKLETLNFLAVKYDVSDKLDALIQILERYKNGEDKMEIKGIFSIEKETIDRQFELYDVKV
jgi:DNA-binding transcriptional ArsR family regulator